MNKKNWKKTKISHLRNRWLLILFKNSNFLRLKLKYFIQTNNLYSTEEFKISKLLAGANQKINKVALSSIIYFQKEIDEEFSDVFLNIKIKKMGADFDSRIPDTIEQIQALFGPVEQNENNWDHHFLKILLKKGDDKVVLIGENMFFKKNQKNRGKIKIDKRREIKYKDNPGILIIGNSGSGKSYCLYSLLPELNREGIIYIIDPKFGELKEVASRLTGCEDKLFNQSGCAVAHTLDDIIALLELAVAEIYRRNDEKDCAYNQLPIFVVLDEYLILKSRLEIEKGMVEDKELLSLVNKKKKITYSQYLDELIKIIALLGRSAGVTLVVALQRLGANDLPLVIKDNLSTKIGLGNLSPANFEMLFGVAKSQEIISRGQGEGYVEYNGNIELFAVPKVKCLNKKSGDD